MNVYVKNGSLIKKKKKKKKGKNALKNNISFIRKGKAYTPPKNLINFDNDVDIQSCAGNFFILVG